MSWLEENLASIISLVVAIAALYKAVRMTPHEIVGAESSAAKQFAEAAASESQRAFRLVDRVAVLEGRVDALVRENNLLREDNTKYLETLTNWAEGIKLLLLQIKANQLTAAWVPLPDEVEKFSKSKNE